MKPYNIHSLLALAAAALIVAACQSDYFEGLADGRCPIAFDAQLGWEKDQTRANIQTAANLTGFKVTCVKKNASKGNSYYFQNLVVTKNGDNYTNATDYYWLATGQETYDFYAYAPSSYPSVTNPATPGAPTFTYDASTTNCDLTAAVVTGKSDRPTTSADAVVGLTFDHLLTGIRFKVADGCDAIKIKKIEIKGIEISGSCTFDAVNKKWVWEKTKINGVVKTGNITRSFSGTGFDTSSTDKNIDALDASNNPTEASFFVIPQTIPSGAKIELTYNDGTTDDKTVTADLSGTWTQGKVVTYAINVESSEPTVNFTFNLTDGTVENWDGTGGVTQKTAWAANDVIYVGFYNQNSGLLKFTYDGTNWTQTTIGTLNLNTVATNAASFSTNKCLAFWVEGNPGDYDLELVSGTGYKFARNGQCFLRHYNTTYSYEASTKTISSTFKLVRVSNSVKIAVSGLGNDTWQICAKEIRYYTNVYAKENGYSIKEDDFETQKGIDRAFGGGYKIGSETLFHVGLNTANSKAYSSDAGSVIYLKNTSTNKIYRKQFSGKYLRSKTNGTMGGKTINITFNDTWSEISASAFNALTSDNMDVMPATTGELNGHTWVDLGLPSGTKWATCNLGADSPTAYGNYFAWGETTAKSGFSSSTSATYNKTIDQLRSAGIIDGNNNLTATYDAATQKWGADWRIPTKTELQELVSNCTWTWKTSGNTDYNGVAGYEVKGSNGNSIFLPAAKYYKGNTFKNTDDQGRYWTSTADSETTNYSFYLYLAAEENEITSSSVRYYGQTIRPVTK